MWDRMPANQLGKCAESKALDKAFPQRLGGLPISEELDRGDEPVGGDEPVQTSAAPAVAAFGAVARPSPFEPDAEAGGEEEVEDADIWTVVTLEVGKAKSGHGLKVGAPMWGLTASNRLGATQLAFTTDEAIARTLRTCHETQRDFAMEWESRDTYDAIISVSPLS